MVFAKVHMIKIQGTIPATVGVAVSGGVDSMAVLDFLRRGHSVTAYWFDHGTEFGSQSLSVVANYCKQYDITLCKGQLSRPRPAGVSSEEHWRNERYTWLRDQPDVIVTAHHLDDCVETWIWSSMHGESKLIPYRHHNVIRPFMTTHKHDLVDWAQRQSVPWVNDPSNSDLRYTRNHIRHEMMPHVLKVNPGIHKNIKKKIIERQLDDHNHPCTV